MARVLALESGGEVAIPPGRDVEARRFYGSTLGLRETMREPGTRGMWFRVSHAEGGEVIFKLVPRSDFEPANKEPQARFRVDQAEALRAACDRARFRHYDAPHVVGTRGFYAHDPFGNRIELRERPKPARTTP